MPFSLFSKILSRKWFVPSRNSIQASKRCQLATGIYGVLFMCCYYLYIYIYYAFQHVPTKAIKEPIRLHANARVQKKGIHHCIQLRHIAERVVVLSRNNLSILDTCLEFQVDLRHEVPLQHQELATPSCAIGATSNSESGFAQGWSTICTALSSVKTRLSSTIRCTKKRCPFVQTPTEADLESKRLLSVKQE